MLGTAARRCVIDRQRVCVGRYTVSRNRKLQRSRWLDDFLLVHAPNILLRFLWTAGCKRSADQTSPGLPRPIDGLLEVAIFVD